MPAIKDFQGLRTHEIRSLVKHDHLTPEELDRVAAVRTAGTIEAIAASPLLSASTQRALAVSGRDGITRALARNPAVTEPVQQILLREGTITVDCALMGNPNLAPDVARADEVAREPGHRAREKPEPGQEGAAHAALQG